MGWNTVVAGLIFWASGLGLSVYFARPDRQTIADAVRDNWQKHLALGSAIAVGLVIVGLMSYGGDLDFRADRGR